jgi:Diacylglycerol kinase catalytic domain
MRIRGPAGIPKDSTRVDHDEQQPGDAEPDPVQLPRVERSARPQGQHIGGRRSGSPRRPSRTAAECRRRGPDPSPAPDQVAHRPDYRHHLDRPGADCADRGISGGAREGRAWWIIFGAALTSGRLRAGPREHAAAPPQRPFLIMNPRSGGEKVAKFGLAGKAAALGAEVALLEGPGIIGVAALARQAADGGADLLGVAGGDGTIQPPAWRPSATASNRIDLGLIGDRTFVNNASFDAYAQVVQSPAYRDDKTSTALAMLPDLLIGHQGALLVVRADGQVILDGPQAVLVSNNPYETSDIAGLGRRARLDHQAAAADGVGTPAPPGAHVHPDHGQRPRDATGNIMTAATFRGAAAPQLPRSAGRGPH